MLVEGVCHGGYIAGRWVQGNREFNPYIPSLLGFVMAAMIFYTLMRTRRQGDIASHRVILIGFAASIAIVCAQIIRLNVRHAPVIYSSSLASLICWNAAVVFELMLPMAWPILVLEFTRTGWPTQRRAGLALTFFALAALFCAGTSVAALVHLRGIANTWRLWVYTTTPALLMILSAAGLILWLRPHPGHRRLTLLLIGTAAILAMGALPLWEEIPLTVPRWPGLWRFISSGMLAQISTSIVLRLILWPLAPLALLLFATRPLE
jgi:hypothetical protein